MDGRVGVEASREHEHYCMFCDSWWVPDECGVPCLVSVSMMCNKCEREQIAKEFPDGADE